MNATPVMFALAIFVLAGAGAAGAEEREPPVVVYTEGLQPRVAEQVQKHAQEGITSLQRYLERTRKQNGLYLEDVMSKPEKRADFVAASPPKVYRSHANEWR